MDGVKYKVTTIDDRVFIKNEVHKEEYSLFVSDFSSFMFDFIYMDVPVISFIPDYDEFTCGMNGYRRVDFMDKVKVGDICKTANEAIDNMESYFKTGKGMEYNVHFFGEKDGTAREAIYNMLMEETEQVPYEWRIQNEDSKNLRVRYTQNLIKKIKK